MLESQVHALVLGGGLIVDPKLEQEFVKGWASLGDELLVEGPLKAVLSSKKVDEVVLVGPLAETLPQGYETVSRVEGGSKMMGSIEAGLAYFSHSKKPVIIVAGDTPFITSVMIDQFIDSCMQDEETSAAYGFVPQEVYLEKFSSAPRTWVTMKEGVFCGGGLAYLTPQAFRPVLDKIAEVLANRKSPLKLAGYFGLWSLVKLVFGCLSIKDLEGRAEYILKGLKARGISCPFGEVGFNVDDSESLVLAREYKKVRQCEMMSKKEVVATRKAPEAIGPYSQAVKANGFIFCSGQIPLDAETGELVGETVKEQAHKVFQNMKVVLEAGGSSLSKVVKVNLYLQDMANFQEVNSVYAEYFVDPFPARAAVEVARLPKDVLVEAEAVALCD